MNIHQTLALLGSISPADFMQHYWQKKPLLIRQAIAGFQPLLSRTELLQLAEQEDVESRLVVQKPLDKKTSDPAQWSMKHGPFTRKNLPPFKQPGWTVLVQGVDMLHDGVHALMQQFRFVPDARLDDLMISYATEGGGVGPHFDSYDVFLLQAQGRRHWRIGRQTDFSLQPNVPLKILAHFEPEEEFVLEPGDMLYLPPRYAHDGVAQGECMTYSIGFRSPAQEELQREILQRLAETVGQDAAPVLYQDPLQPAVAASGAVPAALLQFSVSAVQAALQDPLAIARALGEYLTEPKAQVWFESAEEDAPTAYQNIVLSHKTRMLYDEQHIFINGESFIASGLDAQLMQAMANARCLTAADVMRLSAPAQEILRQWCEDGWAGYV
jgi:50S ribosomal protein L16 3-hydroxylase